jgi:hypothetical protein
LQTFAPSVKVAVLYHLAQVSRHQVIKFGDLA